MIELTIYVPDAQAVSTLLVHVRSYTEDIL